MVCLNEISIRLCYFEVNVRSFLTCTSIVVLAVFTARRSFASAVLVIAILSVRLSVTRVLCDKTKEDAADILILYERVITLVFLYQQMLVGDYPFHLKCARKVTHTPLINADFDQYLLIKRPNRKCWRKKFNYR